MESECFEWKILKYRSRFDIVGEILQSAVGGATKTRLMYDAFLSHGQVEEYLDFLLGKKLISLAQDKKHYAPTEKGLRFLAMHDEIKDAVSIARTQSISPEAQLESPEFHEGNELAKPPSQGRREPANRG